MNSIKRFSLYGARLNPVRDWGVLFVSALLALVVVVLWNMWLYTQVINGAAFGSAPLSVAVPIKQSSLDELAKIFDDRAVEQEKYKNGVYHFVDPSK